MAVLELLGVGRTYAVDPPVAALTGATLTLHQGEFLAIQGPSGSGKSTLLNLIALIDQPSDGTYIVDGTDVGALDERARSSIRASTFGFVFQSFHLIQHRTARENVELGLVYHEVDISERSARASQALDLVGIGNLADRRASKLSGGERQRVAIARAVVADAPVLVADEPTGNLDSAAGRVVVELLAAIHRSGRTVILVTHDADVAAVADRRLTMRDGRILTDSGAGAATSSDAAAGNERGLPARGSKLRAIDLMREATDGIRGRVGRSTALVTAVAVAVALVVATAGLAQTASSQVSERFDAERNREVTVIVPQGDVVTERDGASKARLDPDAENRVQTLAGVEHAGILQGHDQQTVRVGWEEPAQAINIAGASPGALAASSARIQWAVGHEHRLSAGEVLLGMVPREQLELAPLQADPAILIDGVPFAVAGIVRSATRVPELVASIVMTRHEASRFSAPVDVRMLIRTVPGAALQVARQAPVAVDPLAPTRLEVKAPPDPDSLRDAIQSDLATTLLALATVAALASIVGVANAMMVSVLERIGEFGLRRAIGARPVHILGQTTAEALLLGLTGGVAGFLVGSAGVLVVTTLNRWQPVLDLRLALLALLGGAVVGSLGGLAAAARASRIQPSDALRR